MTKGALIVGAGTGISASFARLLAKEGYKIVLASRDPGKLERLARETGATCCAADASDPASVDGLFTQVDQILPSLDACLFNASARAQGPITEIDPMRARETLLILSYGGFLVAQAAARRMLPKGRGHDPADRGIGERQRLSAVGRVRHGQVCTAWPCAIACPRAVAQRNSRRPLRHRR